MEFWNFTALIETNVLIEIGVGLALILFARYGLRRVIRRMQRTKVQLPVTAREKLEHIIYLPLSAILWIVGVTYLVAVLANYTKMSFVTEHLPLLRKAALACCLSWFLLRWKGVIQNDYHKQKEHLIDTGMINILGRIVTIVIIIITAMFILQIFGLDILPLVAFGGIGAAAVGFAGKDVIANFFGGMMLYVTRPFQLGDLILLPNQHIEGYVEEIGWYLTSIRDKDKRPVYLPNAIFSNELVINVSRMSRRKIEEKIAIRYDDYDKMEGIVEGIKTSLSSYSALDTTYPLLVYFYSFNQYSLDIHVEAYTFSTKWEEFLPVKEQVLKRIQKVVAEAGAAMPFPTTTIELFQK